MLTITIYALIAIALLCLHFAEPIRYEKNRFSRKSLTLLGVFALSVMALVQELIK